ncbi:MAG: GHKL domain-containing protein [Bacilli bacterium]|nr:GHKL domain-containing protein [Bacilli bacterium]
MKTEFKKRLTIKWMGKLISSTVIYTVAFVFIYFSLSFICHQINWYDENLLYQILKIIDNNDYLILFIWLIGFIYLFFHNLMQLMNYMEEIANASKILIENNHEKIHLPEDLKEIEIKMNLVKQQSIANAKKADEQEKRKNDLIVYLAHDIKTPLTSMIGYLSLLDEITDMPKKKRQKYINIALEKSYKLEELMNELFDITRFNAETIQLKKEIINLSLMIEQITDDFYPLLMEKEKMIIFKKKESIHLNADPDKLARVLNNVIKNAINYSPKKSKITIELQKEEEMAHIVITNMGHKINEEELSKIFEKFYRMDHARNSKTGGSGLGLAIAKEIVEMHQGTINAKSDENETKFIISLPISNEKNLKKKARKD